MEWTIEFTSTAKRQLKKMDKASAKKIIDYMSNRISILPDPRSSGKKLVGNLGDFWRYRVGDYRIVCDIHDDKLVIHVITTGHRKDVYKN